MKSFSERKGLKATMQIAQVDGMNEELRNSLWNALDLALWSTKEYLYKQYGSPGITPFARALWFSHFKEPMDSIPDRTAKTLLQIRSHFFACKWNEVYDFLEFAVDYYEDTKPQLAEFLNQVLERELSGFRFIGTKLADITVPEEAEMLANALADTRFGGVAAHLQRALELYADRQSPDYRNSIKESISAVEAMARIVANNPKATLGDALKSIEKHGDLHSAFKEGFMKLYGYTSDEGGIRHAMLDEPNLRAADARYFLLSCTAFTNYLKAQIAE